MLIVEAKKPSNQANKAALCRSELCCTLPHGAMFFSSDAAPEQMADWQMQQKITVPMNGNTHASVTETSTATGRKVVGLVTSSGNENSVSYLPMRLLKKTKPLSSQLV